MDKGSLKAYIIHIRGLVQGVGFRPFIYRLAHRYAITGWVENGIDGVTIHAEAGELKLLDFIAHIKLESPEAAQIRSLDYKEYPWQGFNDFSIRKSSDTSGEITEISPDIAVCQPCLEDMKSQPHRKDYAFINCTNCGPRFTIISDLPYDRHKTTMEIFEMCPRCRSEYEDILDRRFHAQPVACNICGPHYSMIKEGTLFDQIGDILEAVSQEISFGNIVAIKGLGGFHLACNALDERACKNLRAGKNRDGKPFAVMFKDLESLEEYLNVGDAERISLLSWRRPIVILENKPGDRQLARAVSNGFETTGAMLPYMPFHYLLFEKLSTPAIVLTSGNIADEPVLIDNGMAAQKLSRIAGSLVVYNRHILNRTDDSVVMIVNEKERMIRRSRGYVPSPVELALPTEGIFAAGAELVNCFCIGKGNQALLSQHIGDLKNLETLEFYEEAVKRYRQMFRFSPGIFAVDLHPDYLSTRYCQMEKHRFPEAVITKIQHHHAHIASCMAEHGLDETVIGISLDGVGYGTDGNIWGFELMTCDLVDFQRRLHLAYTAQPGGDRVTKEPWRMAVSYLYRIFGERIYDLPVAFLREIGHEKINMIISAIDKGINSPLTSSAGRLFDAVAAITGICLHSDFHAEAPMRLEKAAARHYAGYYDFYINTGIDIDPVISGIIEDMGNNTDISLISARFHNTVCEIMLRGSMMIREESGLAKLVLSGGTFQNRYLLSRAENMLQSSGFQVFSHQIVPSNDGGIALGQLAVAAKRRHSGII